MAQFKTFNKESGVIMKNLEMNRNGVLSIESKNIFTILKKWLYTEKDIVFRELISNATDAIEKLSKLHGSDNSIEAPRGKIIVTLDTQQKILTIQDNGIGMSSEEVDRYINQIAFSGANDFIKNNNEAGKDTIIGHFGVGFYSSFMLADHVAIETKSYKSNESGIRWDCLSDMSFKMKEIAKEDIGTTIILYLNEDNPYLKKPELVHEIIKKYFVFSKTDVFFNTVDEKPTLINDTNPIWKMPNDSIRDEDMITFYKEYYKDISDPLFWIQFQSIDLGIRGILFFRDTKNGTEELDGTIKVYNRGVYVGENIKELIPKFVNLQHGILECDYLPLVVSRNNIRENEEEQDIMGLIYECLVQEVAIAMNDMFVNQRDKYEEYWSNLNAFVKYATLQDKVFASVMLRKVIFKDIYGNYQTIQEYCDTIAAHKHPNLVYYSSDSIEQAHYIEIFRKCSLNALLFDHVIDQPFMRKYEVAHPNIKFIRIDSNIESLFEGHLLEGDDAKITTIKMKIQNALGDRLNGMNLKITNLEQDSISTLIINDEQSRRMADMLEIYGFINSTDFSSKKMQAKSTLLINLNNSIIRYILESIDKVVLEIVINQLLDLALMSQQSLQPEDVEKFICRSEAILAKSIGPQYTSFPEQIS